MLILREEVRACLLTENYKLNKSKIFTLTCTFKTEDSAFWAGRKIPQINRNGSLAFFSRNKF